MKNQSLHAAKKNKNDEFYTQLSDVENELKRYTAHFRGKTILCNCDDPYESAFFKFFAMSFNSLGIKKLIATCYDGSPIAYTQLPLFSELEAEETLPNKSKRAYKVEITEVKDYNGDGAVDLADVRYLLQNGKNTLSVLKENGDFRSPECLELLKQADIVVTNPPFSLFREYVAQLAEYEKQFIIIGNKNAITYKEIFPLIMQNKMWLGYGFKGGDAYFVISENNIKDYVDGVLDKEKKLVHFRNCCWFTNLDHSKRHEDLILYKRYNEEEYPKYDNYDAINVDKVAEIPCDYYECIGVPITFLDKHNPDQFEIIGATESEGKGFSGGLWDAESKVAQAVVNGERKYKRLFVRARLGGGH